jgi:hypothetical protein
MFGALKKMGGYEEEGSNIRKEQDESQSFLSDDTDESIKRPTSRKCSLDTAGPWKVSTAILAVLFVLSLSSGLRHNVSRSYESGFETDLRKSWMILKLTAW